MPYIPIAWRALAVLLLSTLVNCSKRPCLLIKDCVKLTTKVGKVDRSRFAKQMPLMGIEVNHSNILRDSTEISQAISEYNQNAVPAIIYDYFTNQKQICHYIYI